VVLVAQAPQQAVVAATTTTVATTLAAAMAAVAGNGRLLTAHKGDADDREENRDSKNKRTIHPSSSN
jgi:hypothetical protein